MNIVFRSSRSIPTRSVQSLFRRMEFSDWWTLKDIKWYLEHALFVVSAWDRCTLAGLGVLTGEGGGTAGVWKHLTGPWVLSDYFAGDR